MEMDSEAERKFIPALIYADYYPEYSPPIIRIVADAGGAQFRDSATLIIPNLLYLFRHPGTEGAFTHLAVDISSPFFGDHDDWTYELTAALDGQTLGSRLFHVPFRRHQFLIPLSSFRHSEHRVKLT